MKVSSADQAVRRYLELASSLSAPRSRAVGERARVPSSYCLGCGFERSQVSVSKTKGVRVTCASCGRVWSTVTVVEGVSGGGPRCAAPNEAALDLLAELGRCLSRLPLWHVRALLEYAGGPAGPGRRVELVARRLAERYPRRVGGWSPRIVRELIDGERGRESQGARARLERELRRAELFEA